MKNRTTYSVQIVLALLFLLCVVLPLFAMLARITPAALRTAVSSPQFLPALRHSVWIALCTSVLAVLLALALAYALTRTAMRCKAFFAVVLTFPMLIPSISHGMGLILLFGANGILTNILPISCNIYGFGGILTGSLLFSFPVAMLMLINAFKYEDMTPYEAAKILGIDRLHQWTAITLPYLRKPLICAFFTVFTLVVTDYGVPLMIGGKYITLPLILYQEVIGQLKFDVGMVIGLFLLLPAVAAFLIDVLWPAKSGLAFVNRAFAPARTRADALGTALCALVSVCVVLPIATFILLTFIAKYPLDLSLTLAHVEKAFTNNLGLYLRNSLVISLCTSVLGCALTYLAAYCAARVPTVFSRFTHLLSMLTMAIPGLVLGLSYVLFFKGTPLYATLAIIIIANIFHFMASPYLMIYNTLASFNTHLEAVGSTLGISRARMLLDVFLPQTAGTVVEMLSYFFVNCMLTISAVSFLSNTFTKPASLMITQFENMRLLECSAFVSLLILFINLLVKSAAALAKRRIEARENA